MKKIYTEKINAVLPRILSFYNKNYIDQNLGNGDRFRWAWGLIDYTNSTYVCSMFGLSCLIKYNFFKKNEDEIFETIDNMFCNLKYIIKKNYGFNESFPNEHSFCVTALVAEAALGTLENLNNYLTKVKIQKYKEICTSIILKLNKLSENHAFISNHLATAALAYCRYWKLTKNNYYKLKYEKLLNKILDNQSKEGWYKEYDGFDPGYESLSINYLSQIYKITKNKKLYKSLKKSCNFIKLFFLSNNNFGGIYGSRCTEFLFPGGFEIVNKFKFNFPIQNVREGIMHNYHANILSMDDMNIVPMFNSYCLSLVNISNNNIKKKKTKKLKKYFADAGIFIVKNKNYELIVNCKKGGCYHYLKKKRLIKNYGVLIKYNNKFASTQKIDQKNFIKFKNNQIIIFSKLKKINFRNITELEFILLRIFCYTIFKIKFFREVFKIFAANKLINSNIAINATNCRKIDLDDNQIHCKDEIKTNLKYKKINSNIFFNHIHMASQGYWYKS